MELQKRVITKNLMEELVDMQLDDYIQAIGMCPCEQCKEDVRAFALNNLPPRYIVTTDGGVFSRVNDVTNQAQADIGAAIMKAIRVVKINPRHDEV